MSSLGRPEVAISGISGLVNHPKIPWASLQNIPLLVRCIFTSPKTCTTCTCMHERWAKYLKLISRAWVSSFEVKSRADEDVICNFRIISQTRNSRLFGNLELMRTGLMISLAWRVLPKSQEIIMSALQMIDGSINAFQIKSNFTAQVPMKHII